METNSRPETEGSTSKQDQVELVYQELKRVEVYIKRIEATTSRSLESAENRLKSVLADFERQGNRMKNGYYVNKQVSFYFILCAVIFLLFACLMCYLWVDAVKDRDKYKVFYEYFQEQKKEKKL